MARSSTSFVKGQAIPKGGRPKGSKTRITLAMKEIIAEAAHAAGDQIAAERAKKAKDEKLPVPASEGGALEYLTTMARVEPKAFLAVLGKTIEKSVKLNMKAVPTVVFRDYTGLRLENLGPSILKRIEQERSK